MNSINPILVQRFRGDVLESFHRGVVCIVNAKKEVVFSLGDIKQICYPRSALKFIQVLPLLEDGGMEHFGFTMEEVAIMCGSHNGQLEHIKVVESILNKIGLTQDSLRCGAQYPTLTEDKNNLIKSDSKPQQIHNNCSGKHAGFLAYCVFKGLETSDYIDSNHPLQLRIKELTAEIHELPIEELMTGLDGCSAPIFSLPVYNQALAYTKLSNPESFFEGKRLDAVKTMVEAVTAYPFMIAGTNRYCTDLMELSKGSLLAKTGADGVYSIGFIGNNLGCCIKVDDGLMGPQYAIAQEIISKTDLLTPEDCDKLKHYLEEPIKNWNKMITGQIVVNTEVFNNCEDVFKALVH